MSAGEGPLQPVANQRQSRFGADASPTPPPSGELINPAIPVPQPKGNRVRHLLSWYPTSCSIWGQFDLIFNNKKMAHEIAFTLQGEETPALKQVLHHLKDIRNITHAEGSNISGNWIACLLHIIFEANTSSSFSAKSKLVTATQISHWNSDIRRS